MYQIKPIDLNIYEPRNGILPLFEFSISQIESIDDIEGISIAAQIEASEHGGFFPLLSKSLEAALEQRPRPSDDRIFVLFDEGTKELVLLLNGESGKSPHAAIFESYPDAVVIKDVIKH